MTHSPIETSAHKVACESETCDKEYASRGGMRNHFERNHKAVEEIQSPLGIFPSSDPARMLFTDETRPSTQGNSAGQVNSLKVSSAGSFICAVCDNPFERKTSLDNHKKTEHKNPSSPGTPIGPSTALVTPTTPTPVTTINPTEQENEEFTGDEQDEKDLYDALDIITQNVIEPAREAETREDIKEMLLRFKSIMSKKNKLIKEAAGNVRDLDKSTTALKHDAEVIERQVIEIEELKNDNKIISNTAKVQRERNKDVLIADKLKKREKDKLKKEKEVILKELETLRESNNSLNEENNNLIEKVKAKNNLIKGLNKASDIENVEVEIEVIEPAIIMKRNTTSQKCNACNKSFKTSSDLENHMLSKHTEKQCIYCEFICKNERELAEHHKNGEEIDTANSTCSKCNQKFTKQGIRRHKQICHGPLTDLYCPECGEECSNGNALKKHQDEEHKMERVKSRVVCKHWRRGHCDK